MRSRDELLHDGAFFGAAPFGSLLAGTLARRIGAPPTAIVTGAFCVAGSLWFTLVEVPELEQHPDDHIVKPRGVTGAIIG